MRQLLLTLPLLMTLSACVSAADVPKNANEWGSFEGEVVTTWNKDGRTMTLRAPFAYIAPNKRKWIAPEGRVVDGASIPQWAWSIVGGPLEGAYRDASVIHDIACVDKTQPWESVHMAFYTAMRARGVSEIKAKIMYAAVYHFGPRWPNDLKIIGVSPENSKSITTLANGLGTDLITMSVDKSSATYMEKPIVIGSLPANISDTENGQKFSLAIEKIKHTTQAKPPPAPPPPVGLFPVPEKSEGYKTFILKIKSRPSDLSEEQFADLRQKIESSNLSLEAIENFTP